ncbi:MAG TPA: protein kinase [Thermoanaerobaculia bacterium]|nr:protein kinase [Thermoanaerobaculia bacterium]
MGLETSGLLDDKYEIIKRLAIGGMGDVYLARHRHLHEQRVVKVLRADLATDPDAMQRFQHEARVATQIKHPNVAILYDFSRLPDGRFYMVIEYIEGEDVGSRIKKGPIHAPEAIDLAIQALRGLDAIHSAGLIHRDVSPDNLMITKDRRGRGLLKIIDLGLAKDLAPEADLELTQAGAFLGKFQYCSPEQAGSLKDEPLDHRSDLYSLAQVLYEMLTGLPPFESESQHGFVLKRLTEEPLALRRRNPRVPLPAALEAVVMRGLARDRNDRFPDAPAFITALVKVAEGLKELSTQELSAADVQKALESQGLAGATSSPSQSGLRAQPSAAARTGAPPTASPAAPPRAVAPSAAAAKPPAAPPAAKPAVPATPRPPARGAASLELSKVERDALLARIDKAASRVQEGGQLLAQAEAALKEGRFEDARQQIQKLETATPVPRGVAELKRRLAEAEEIARRRQQVVQAEQMLEKYLLDRSQTLASLALETLLDLYPNHPKRHTYLTWIGSLADDAERQKRAEKLFVEGQAAAARGDLAGARKSLAEVERQDPTGKLAGSLLAEINELERSRAQGQQAASVRRMVEEALRRGAIDEASRGLEQLSTLEVTKVTLDMLRGQVDEARQQHAREAATAGFETAYREAVGRRDWHAARHSAYDFEAAFADSPRPHQMLAEVARLQEAEQRQQALAEGLRAFDGYLRAGEIGQAEVALKVLRQLGADDSRVHDAERRLNKARG